MACFPEVCLEFVGEFLCGLSSVFEYGGASCLSQVVGFSIVSERLTLFLQCKSLCKPSVVKHSR